MWVVNDRARGPKSVHDSQPEGKFGWQTEQVPLIGELPPAGTYAYAVVVTYTTGSTFGSESGIQTVAVVCATGEQAIDAQNAIEENGKRRLPRAYTTEVHGVEIDCGTWTGYFESIDYVTVELVPVVA